MALFIETNGQYVDEEFLKTLNSASNKSEILIRISLDSYKKEHHEIDRGLNSFDPAIIAIKALAIKGISVSVNKVYRKSDFDFNFSIKEYIKFCKQLGVSRFEFSRMVPFGRAQEKDLLTSEQIVSVRKSLSEFYNYGKDIISTDFYYLKYSQNCSRLKTKGWGLYAYPYGFSLCPLQPEVKLGDLNSMQNILKQNLLIKFNAMRKEAFKHLPRNMIFGCTECRRYLTS
jgi:MoaA/NifB/PqqE/SkfB family radical SAM enzyme